jgi:homoserine O-acetyltransferase/O-succinyltransferase
MLVQKKRFALPAFTFLPANRTIPVEIGYETYGTLNADRSNAVLLCHYFTGTSHAAGRYTETDPAPGWWDALIGPGKVVDTDRWFVICPDVISNINAFNPNVIATGPSSIDPTTGTPYGMRFPIFTLQDVVRVQRELVASLGIERLAFVLGPSMGGLQAFAWGRVFPEMVGGVCSVFATPMMRPICLMVPNQLGIEAIRLDPNWCGGDYYGQEPPRDGLLLAFKILLTITRTDHWAESNFGRRFLDPEFKGSPNPFLSFAGRFLVEEEIEKTVVQRMQFFDPNAYLYIAKANTLFDLAEPGQTLAEALGMITPPVLMIIDESDRMFTPEQAQQARALLPDAQVHCYDSKNGHLSCIFETDYLVEPLREFIARRGMKTTPP